MTLRPSTDAALVGVRGLALDDPFLCLMRDLMPLRFESLGGAPDAVIRLQLLEGGSRTPKHLAGAVLDVAPAAPRCDTRRGPVGFAPTAPVPFPFRGRRLTTHVPQPCAPLAPAPDEVVLASDEGCALWTAGQEDGRPHWRSALAWPEVAADTCFFEAFNSLHFVGALPVVDFLRRVAGETGDAPPPVRACFVIDDPNLHWVRYGYVDYAAVVSHARDVGYHMSFATIPLDTWFTHRRAADIFKASPDRVSLLVHGNNHLKGELARPYDADERARLLSEAIERMQRFSARSGVPFSPVMVPPHGACSEAVLSSMRRNGYEAACVSSGSIAFHNPGRPWRRLLGYHAYEVIGGCPVIPRWGLKNDVDNAVLLAAYLGQAVIVMGHHQDMADGLGEYDRVARHINTLGDVTWADMRTIAALGRSLAPHAARDEEPAAPVAAADSFGDIPFSASLRRVATEARDRLLPVYSRLTNPRRATA